MGGGEGERAGAGFTLPAMEGKGWERRTTKEENSWRDNAHPLGAGEAVIDGFHSNMSTDILFFFRNQNSTLWVLFAREGLRPRTCNETSDDWSVLDIITNEHHFYDPESLGGSTDHAPCPPQRTERVCYPAAGFPSWTPSDAGSVPPKVPLEAERHP